MDVEEVLVVLRRDATDSSVRDLSPRNRGWVAAEDEDCCVLSPPIPPAAVALEFREVAVE